jgi:hypothetical protein
MTRDEAREKIRRAFLPLGCGVEGRFDDPIRFQVTTPEGRVVHSGQIPKSQWTSEELLRNALENHRDLVRQKGFELDE